MIHLLKIHQNSTNYANYKTEVLQKYNITKLILSNTKTNDNQKLQQISSTKQTMM